MKKILSKSIVNGLKSSVEKGLIPQEISWPKIYFEIPKEKKFGDLTTNIAFLLAPAAKMPPRKLAEIIIQNIPAWPKVVDKVEIAGSGFINLFLKPQFWHQILRQIQAKPKEFCSPAVGRGRKVNIEFVSANPTGPLHVGHGRCAVVGDTLARILEKVGYRVTREYYINDAGRQMEILGKSVLLRYYQEMGKDVPFLADGYQGEYIRDIARDLIREKGDSLLSMPEKEAVPLLTRIAADIILRQIQDDLVLSRVQFDQWFSERSLYDTGSVEKAIKYLRNKGWVYEQDGALWMKTSSVGDEKDRVVIRSSGEPTYYASDIAYHRNKFQRKYARLIDIWGADHHGYVNRIRAVARAFSVPEERVSILLVQLVRLMRGETPVNMSTRKATFTTLSEVIEEVGVDAARFFFLLRRFDTHLDFDLDLAKKQSSENPVYYTQYAHARVCSIFREIEKRGLLLPEPDLSLLQNAEEIQLIQKLSLYPQVLTEAAEALEPHRLTFYLIELATLFHKYYNLYRVISEDSRLSSARIVLVSAIRIVIADGLKLLGISTPTAM
ncbi:MAG: arginine--tRNA ligase [bacterium]